MNIQTAFIIVAIFGIRGSIAFIQDFMYLYNFYKGGAE